MSSERVERRLAAILAADVAGYSRLMGRDEEGMLAQLKSFRKALVDPAIAEHRGRIVKTTGDGMLIEFASAVDAARCAVDIQRRMATQNTDVPQDQRIEFRIGIHLGDIIIDDNDIFGDGVNIAARLEGIGEPGGVCISDDAHRQIRGKVDILRRYGFADAQEHRRADAGLARTDCRRSWFRGPNGFVSSRASSCSPQQTLCCSSAIHQHERRSGTGVFC